MPFSLGLRRSFRAALRAALRPLCASSASRLRSVLVGSLSVLSASLCVRAVRD